MQLRRVAPTLVGYDFLIRCPYCGVAYQDIEPDDGLSSVCMSCQGCQSKLKIERRVKVVYNVFIDR